VLLLFCVGRGLAIGWSLTGGVLPRIIKGFRISGGTSISEKAREPKYSKLKTRKRERNSIVYDVIKGKLNRYCSGIRNGI
jgi:hypothetical protein